MAKFNAFGRERGWIEVICGPMFAGKSEELLKRLKRLEYADVPFIIFKPKIDTRSKKNVTSRDGRVMKAIEFVNPYEILGYVLENQVHPQVVAIDEAQFATIDIVDVCESLADSGVIVYVSALDKDFKNEPFIVTSKLLCHAEYITKLSAVCTECGAPGTVSQRLVDNKPVHYNSPIFQIGNYESYTVKCRHHHKVPGKPASMESRNFKTLYNKKTKQENKQ
ncbi:MAG: thymidine kinase [Mycoplasma sp.]|nr:thymidine kinase [Mycoplasma sp.]